MKPRSRMASIQFLAVASLEADGPMIAAGDSKDLPPIHQEKSHWEAMAASAARSQMKESRRPVP